MNHNARVALFTELSAIHSASYTRALKTYRKFLTSEPADSAIAWMIRHDRFFLLVEILARDDLLNPWLYKRCREVEAQPDGMLDLWARDHRKSTIITWAGTIQEICRNREITACIFSHSRSIAKDFFLQVKTELEKPIFFRLFPDTFWEDCKNESPKWNQQDGLLVKRTTNPKELTLEYSGLVDGMPTGKHYQLRIYDDTVDKDSVGTAEQIKKTTESWELSQSLGNPTAQDQAKRNRAWYIGTRYHFADTYDVMMKRNAATPRIYAATDDGTRHGKPVYMSDEAWAKVLNDNGEYTVSCQYLLNPQAGDDKIFSDEHFRRYELRPYTMNVYIMCDPANSKRKGSDNTALLVVGVDHNLNKYILDGYLHKMDLHERWNAIKTLRAKWRRAPGVRQVWIGYERYGMQTDLQHFESMMKVDGISFNIQELNWTGGSSQTKVDRVRRLEADWQNGRIFFPKAGETYTSRQQGLIDAGQGYLVPRKIRRKGSDGKPYDVAERLKIELLEFPFSARDDGPDCLSRIYDMDVVPPVIIHDNDLLPEDQAFCEG